MFRNRFTRAVTGALLLAVMLVACGNDDDAAGRGSTGAQVGVTALDYEFRGLPTTLRSGAKLELSNASNVEVHELVAIRLPDDETRPVEQILQLPPEELDKLLAPPPAVALVAAPGSSGTSVVGDGTVKQPGRYLVACFIPTGADPDAVMEAIEAFDPEAGDEPPHFDGGPPHTAHGMFAELAVR